MQEKREILTDWPIRASRDDDTRVDAKQLQGGGERRVHERHPWPDRTHAAESAFHFSVVDVSCSGFAFLSSLELAPGGALDMRLPPHTVHAARVLAVNPVFFNTSYIGPELRHHVRCAFERELSPQELDGLLCATDNLDLVRKV